MTTCSYIMVIFGLLSVLGLAIGLRKAPYRQDKLKPNAIPNIKATTPIKSIANPASKHRP